MCATAYKAEAIITVATKCYILRSRLTKCKLSRSRGTPLDFGVPRSALVSIVNLL